ncbi:hypothetical protein Ais01nite_61510 [Asanoa ishikariensis]|uniref:Uncharacterized protein n=1 Tax=Asanoa ishikariensis TaxID=137265 RepID=A0A1H3P4R7_9ACTN|nr:hypothetical protein [Asanoa ishikariensis]GIF68116.1 hypothetical protein Ais01nite_61510 [Asanoa ishikariensis]SDY96068.1 hypothetical protein SAMN05421684_2577 [Asanoa ishikariensis]
MTTWRGVRKELEGAWRSVQYDLTRARSRRKDGEETTELIFPEQARPPRRLRATGGFALASLVGAVGTYFAVVNGLGALLATDTTGQGETPASVVAVGEGTGQRPAAAAEARPERTVRIARQGGPLTVAGRAASAGGAGSWDTHDGVPGGDGPAAEPVPPKGAPVPEDSDDAPPQVDPPAPSPSPTPTPEPTEEPSASPSPTPSASGPDDEPTDEGRKRHRHHRHDQDENP